MKISGSVIMSLVMIFLFAGAITIALGYPPLSRAGPLGVSIPALLLSIGVFVKELKVLKTEEQDNKSREKAQIKFRKEIQLFLWVTALIFLVIFLGHYVGTLLWLISFIYYWAEENLKISLIYAGTFVIFIFVVFDILLQFRLWPGFLFH